MFTGLKPCSTVGLPSKLLNLHKYKKELTYAIEANNHHLQFILIYKYKQHLNNPTMQIETKLFKTGTKST